MIEKMITVQGLTQTNNVHLISYSNIEKRLCGQNVRVNGSVITNICNEVIARNRSDISETNSGWLTPEIAENIV